MDTVRNGHVSGGSSPSPALLFLFSLLLVAASRLPWIGSWYGSDPDSARVVLAAREMASTGAYTASRLPGYPLYEYLITALVSGGPLTTNGISAFCGLLVFALFFLILRRLGTERPLLLSVALVFTPVIYVNSVSTIDYLPALAALLGSLLALLLRRPGLSGFLLGLAAGCRITSGALAIPWLLYIMTGYDAPARKKAATLCAATFSATASLCFLPVLARYGTGFLSVADTVRPDTEWIVEHATTGAWGTVGLLALLIAAVAVPLSAKARLERAPFRRERPLLFLCSTAVLIEGMIYLSLPHEAGYLIPLVPLIFILLALFVRREVLLVFSLLLILAPFLDIGPQGFTLTGPILKDHFDREEIAAGLSTLVGSFDRLPDRSVVVAGPLLPGIQVAMERTTGGDDPQLAYTLCGDDAVKEYLRKGYAIWFVPDTEDFNRAACGTDLVAYGARPLP